MQQRQRPHLTDHSVKVLRALRDADGVLVADLHYMVYIPTSSLQVILRRLEDEHLVTSRPDPYLGTGRAPLRWSITRPGVITLGVWEEAEQAWCTRMSELIRDDPDVGVLYFGLTVPSWGTPRVKRKKKMKGESDSEMVYAPANWQPSGVLPPEPPLPSPQADFEEEPDAVEEPEA